MHPFLSLRLSIILLATGLTAFGQTGRGNVTNAVAPGNVNVTFKTVLLDKMELNLFYKSGNSTLPLSSNATPLGSTVYTYMGNATIDLLRPSGSVGNTPSSSTTATASTSGTSGNKTASAASGGRGPAPLPMTTVGTVTFPQNGDYVVYLKTNDDGTIKTVALSTQFLLGMVKVVNSTSYPMAARIDDLYIPLKSKNSIILSFKGSDQFPLIVVRTDKDPPSGVVQNMVAKPSPGLRTTFTIIVGNIQDVAAHNAEPNFNINPVNDNGSQNPSNTTGRGRRNNRGDASGVPAG